MKRPIIDIDQHNLLIYIVAGSGWFLAGLLEFVDGGKTLEVLRGILFLAIVLVLLYTVIGRRESHDEMTLAYNQDALATGFNCMTITCLLFIIADTLMDYTIPFHFAGYIIIGVGYISTGLRFRQLERDGE